MARLADISADHCTRPEQDRAPQPSPDVLRVIKRIRHLQVGLLELDCQVLVGEECTQILAVFSPAPGTPTAERLVLLGSLGALDPQDSSRLRATQA